MNKKKLGVLIIFVMITAVSVYAVVCTLQKESLKKENDSLRATSTEEYQKKINMLSDDLIAAQQQLQGSKQNNEISVKKAAEFFITTFYDNENSTQKDQLTKIKSLVSDDVYSTLMPDSGGDESDPYNNAGMSYKTWVSEVNSYYSFTDTTTAEIFIYCILHVQSGGTVNTSTPMIFSATMNYVDDNWIVSEIHENRAIRSD